MLDWVVHQLRAPSRCSLNPSHMVTRASQSQDASYGITATLSHLFPTLSSSPASSLHPRDPSFLGLPTGVFLLPHDVEHVAFLGECVQKGTWRRTL